MISRISPSLRHRQSVRTDVFRESLRQLLLSVPWKPILQRVPGTLLLLLIPFAIFGPMYMPMLWSSVFFILHVMLLANNVRSAYAMRDAYGKSVAHSHTDWYEKYCRETGAFDGSDTIHDLPFDQVVHIIILPNYKEDMGTLTETLAILASHRQAMTQYKICLAMEESEVESSEKAHQLLNMFGDSFFEITYTIHPMGRPGEIRGKSSNVAWATTQMAIRGGTRHDHELLTIMDADTCFAEDYFMSLTYYYSVATPTKRRLMMFTPPTVFDRNAKNVSAIVRITDIFWSIGVMANLYEQSKIKIPCSAYSLSMDLAISVNFWDAGAEAIGEDLHMYLKCLFSTKGRLHVTPIFSPASQCNVEGSGSGFKGFCSGFGARYSQAKRHLWGSLDSCYALKRAILSYITMNMSEVEMLKHEKYAKIEEESSKVVFEPWILLNLAHRLLEAHILMGQLYFLLIASGLTIVESATNTSSLAATLWPYIAPVGLKSAPPIVCLTLVASSWLRFCCLPPNFYAWFMYEKYHQWVGVDRWRLQDYGTSLYMRRIDSGADLSYICNSPDPSGDESSAPKVQHLGLRSSLSSPRIYPWALFDWPIILASGFVFYVLPQFQSQLSHLFTDTLEYKVAVKPTVKQLPAYSKTPSKAVLVSFDKVVVETNEKHHQRNDCNKNSFVLPISPKSNTSSSNAIIPEHLKI